MMEDSVFILREPQAHSLEEILGVVRSHLEDIGAERAIVFGSHARGDADRWSDLDLVVVLETDRPFTERGRLLAPLLRALPVAVDLLVYTPKEYERLSARGMGLFARLAEEGRVVYERRRE